MVGQYRGEALIQLLWSFPRCISLWRNSVRTAFSFLLLVLLTPAILHLSSSINIMRLNTVTGLIGLAASLSSARPQLDLSSEFDLLPRTHAARGLPASGKKGVMLMNRIAPSTSTLYIANADGTGARKLLGNESSYEYHGMESLKGG